MPITKALITAANPRQRTLPLQTIIDQEGEQTSTLQALLREAASAGIEEFCVVVCPGDEAAYAEACGPLRGRVRFIAQEQPLGYGHAVLCGRPFVGDATFLHLVGDHLAVADGSVSCARQLIEVAEAEGTPVSAVQPTRESQLTAYGAVGGRLVGGGRPLYQVDNVLEKPTPTVAEQQLVVPGLRAGFYLCFFGMHVLTPTVMEFLGEQCARATAGARVQLSPALARLAAGERYLAFEARGRRYDIGVKYGLLIAQLALALDGRDRDEVLAEMVELLAQRDR